jgi:hypothetical protein
MTRAMSVSFHLVYSSRWQDSQEAEPTKVLAAVVVAVGGGGDVHAAAVKATKKSTPNGCIGDIRPPL